MPTFTIEEIETAFTTWCKLCGATEESLADAWHAFFVHLIPVGAKKMETPEKE